MRSNLRKIKKDAERRLERSRVSLNAAQYERDIKFLNTARGLRNWLFEERTANHFAERMGGGFGASPRKTSLR